MNTFHQKLLNLGFPSLLEGLDQVTLSTQMYLSTLIARVEDVEYHRNRGIVPDRSFTITCLESTAMTYQEFAQAVCEGLEMRLIKPQS